MSDDPIGAPTSARLSSGRGKPRLHERVTEDLRTNFASALVEFGAEKFRPDLVIRSGKRVAIVEIKTGDPELPLPSSTNVQMLILKDAVQKRFGEVVPILVTNYLLDEADRREMTAGGIKVIDIQGSSYDSSAVSKKVIAILDDSDSSLTGTSTRNGV
jgi:hypothetical protein